jgi:predicted outer membrane lipoprotein
MTGYYDYVLGLIPAVMFGITAALTVLGFSLAAAVPIGAGASALVVGHALFVNGPVSSEADTTTTPASASAPATGNAPVNAD